MRVLPVMLSGPVAGGNGDVRRAFHRRPRNAGKADRQAAHSASMSHGTKHVRRAAAGGNANEDIEARRLIEATGKQVYRALFRRVFRAFCRDAKRAVSARDNALHQVARYGKGRRALGGVKHAQPTACTRAYVKEAAALPDARGDCIDGVGNLRNLFRNTGGNSTILVVEDAEHCFGRKGVDVDGPGIASFGGEQGEVLAGKGSHRARVHPRRAVVQWLPLLDSTRRVAMAHSELPGTVQGIAPGMFLP